MLHCGYSKVDPERVSETEFSESEDCSSEVEENLQEEIEDNDFSFLSSKMSLFKREHEFGDSLSNHMGSK